MSIDMFSTEKGGKNTVFHDLNFQSPRYEVLQTVTFKNPSQSLLQILKETGPVANDDELKAAKIRKATDGKKRKTTNFDWEKMAEGLTKLTEDGLLHVITMIHDHKADDTYTKNDVEAGEFSIDLMTMPEHLSQLVWDFLVSLADASPSKHDRLTPLFVAGPAKVGQLGQAAFGPEARSGSRVH